MDEFKAMLSVKQPFQDEMSKPGEFFVWLKGYYLWSERHAFSSRRVNTSNDCISRVWVSIDFLDEWIPDWVAAEIHEFLPDSFGTGVDSDLCTDFHIENLVTQISAEFIRRRLTNVKKSAQLFFPDST